MKKYLFKILSITLAVWMVAITGGVHLWAHDCGCCDVSEVSVINIEQCCGSDEPVEICSEAEHHQQAACCDELAFAGFHDGNTCSTNNCCTVSHSYLKLDEEFSIADKILLKPYQVLASVIQVLNDAYPHEDEFKQATLVSDSSPPGFTGKAFLIFTHTLKVPLSH